MCVCARAVECAGSDKPIHGVLRLASAAVAAQNEECTTFISASPRARRGAQPEGAQRDAPVQHQVKDAVWVQIKASDEALQRAHYVRHGGAAERGAGSAVVEHGEHLCISLRLLSAATEHSGELRPPARTPAQRTSRSRLNFCWL